MTCLEALWPAVFHLPNPAQVERALDILRCGLLTDLSSPTKAFNEARSLQGSAAALLHPDSAH